MRAGEADLRRHALDLRNPAPYHAPGELEAYLALKHDLDATITGVIQLETHLQRVLQILGQ